MRRRWQKGGRRGNHLIIDPARQLGINIPITIYYEEGLGVRRSDLFEHAIDVGRVINTQQSGLIQVLTPHKGTDRSRLVGPYFGPRDGDPIPRRYLPFDSVQPGDLAKPI
jgi:hypothetical protein